MENNLKKISHVSACANFLSVGKLFAFALTAVVETESCSFNFCMSQLLDFTGVQTTKVV